MTVAKILDVLSFGHAKRKPKVSVLRLTGVIGLAGPLGGPLGSRLNVSGLAPLLERAFAPKHLQAVALVINSPGGAPGQSALIARRIRALADEKSVPVLAYVEDVAASGGYWIACAADEIIAVETSLIGSIGVISAGFGFHELIGRLGIERRVHVAGEDKGLLDPFRPETPEDVERLRTLQVDLHESFKAHVRDRRAERLSADESVLFSGAFWTARTALTLGLVDRIGSTREDLRARFGAEVRLRVVEPRQRWWQRRAGHGADVGAALGPDGRRARTAALAADAVLQRLDDRLWWSRCGL